MECSQEVKTADFDSVITGSIPVAPTILYFQGFKEVGSMEFNKHKNLEGAHAFLGASKYHWLRYDDKKMIQVYNNFLATQKGTELHALAANCIEMGVKLPKSKKTLNSYVNDAIGFKMTPEQPLFFSRNCFGTADAISFRKDFLRIHDLKTGSTPASMDQLFIYDALFCLEYDVKPKDIEIENRIYQNSEIVIGNPTSEEITSIMDKIKHFDELLNELQKEG